MGSLYLRGGIWWIGFTVPTGKLTARGVEKVKWVYKSSGYRAPDKAMAQRALRSIEEQTDKKRYLAGKPDTVTGFAETWLASRLGKKWTAKLDHSRVKNHLLGAVLEDGTVFGTMRLQQVRARHVRDLVAQLCRKDLAPRTLRNIYGALHALFQDAVVEELVDQSPCLLKDDDLPAIADRDPRWRATAEYSREEVERLISDPRLPEHHRLWWAIGFLSGMRAGEVAALHWRDYDATQEPLGRIQLTRSFTRQNKVEKGTKTGRERAVPVHPTLAAMLAEWRLTGWEAFQGRPPTSEDLILPNAWGNHLTDNSTKKSRPADLKMLGIWREGGRRFHDARSTFITLGSTDGGEEIWLERVTHNAKGNQFNQYRRASWLAMCRAVTCLKIARRGAGSLHLSLRSGETAMPDITTSSAYDLGKKGIEPSLTPGRHPRSPAVAGTSLRSDSPKEERKGSDCSDVVRSTSAGARARTLLAKYRAGGR